MRKIKFLNKNSFILFWLVFSIIYATLFIGAEFYGSPVNGLNGVLTIAAQWVIVSIAGALLIGLISVNRWVFSIACPVLLVLSVIAAYFRLTMGVSLTPMVIELAMVNDMTTWFTVVSVQLVVAFILMLLLSILIVWIRWTQVSNPSRAWAWALFFGCGIAVMLNVSGSIRRPVIARMPYSFYYSFKEWWGNKKEIATVRTTFDSIPVTANSDGPDVVLVIGESLRPDHLSINGYHRETTPRLARDTAVISFPHVTTDYLFTHSSVPHIMTKAEPGDTDVAYDSQSFITLFNKAGYHTGWLSNQDAVPTYAYFMHEGDTLIQCNSRRSMYSFDKWVDLDLLPHLDDFMTRPGAPKLAVLHTVGSHWWYPSHYPDSLAVFTPEVDSRVISELTDEQLINSYDNTILATDFFLSEVIERLKDRNAVMIYVSDHGEALGENGHYLHADEYDELRAVACLVWTSPEYNRRFSDKVAALKENADRAFTTEAIFHTVIDAAGLSTTALDTEKSFFVGNSSP